MNFKERTSTKVNVIAREEVLPSVYINRSALNKMFVYTDEVADEVGWLGTVVREKNIYQVTDVYLFDQEVHGATTEITPEGLTAFANELLQRPDGMEIWNTMRLWGHSHVNMGISPSGQDDKQMEEFSQIGHEFFLRLICNKKGELAIDVYDYKLGIEFHNVPWAIYEDVMDEQGFHMYQQIEELQEALEALQTQIKAQEKIQLESIKEPIKAEIKQKVRKLVYNKGVNTHYTKNYANGWLTGSSKGFDYPTNGLPDQIDGVKNTVYSFFSQKNLEIYAQDALGMYDLEYLLEQDGYQFSDNDIEIIWSEVSKLQDLMGITTDDNWYGGYY